MKGDKEVIKALNAVLSNSLIGINQYFLHARIVKNWGVEELNDVFYKQSIQEMKWSDKLIERILLLEGLPNLQDLGKLLLGEDVEEMLACDLKLENRKNDAITQAIQICEDKRDYVSRTLLTVLKEGSEEYIDWLETKQESIKDIGLPNFIQSHMSDD